MDQADWFDDFVGGHCERHWPGGGKTPGPAFWEGWREAFARNHVGREEANAASIRMMEAPPARPGDHLRILLEMVGESRRERVGPPPVARDAEADSGRWQARRAAFLALSEAEREALRGRARAWFLAKGLDSMTAFPGFLDALCISRMDAVLAEAVG